MAQIGNRRSKQCSFTIAIFLKTSASGEVSTYDVRYSGLGNGTEHLMICVCMHGSNQCL